VSTEALITLLTPSSAANSPPSLLILFGAMEGVGGHGPAIFVHDLGKKNELLRFCSKIDSAGTLRGIIMPLLD